MRCLSRIANTKNPAAVLMNAIRINSHEVIKPFGTESPPDPALLFQLPDEVRYGASLYAFQRTYEGIWSVDIYFDSASVPQKFARELSCSATYSFADEVQNQGNRSRLDLLHLQSPTTSASTQTSSCQPSTMPSKLDLRKSSRPTWSEASATSTVLHSSTATLLTSGMTIARLRVARAESPVLNLLKRSNCSLAHPVAVSSLEDSIGE